jgi:cysteinyl-tRNA synthetase
MYTCGPTVYAPQHIGNLRSQLFADLLKRTLRFEGYRVTHVINVTDVGHLTDDADSGEDKMEAAARRAGRRAEDIARQYTDQWRRDRARVNCLEPEVLCRATEHVPEQIAMIRQLEAKGFAYRIDDGIYFDVSRFPRYAELARLDLDQATGESRIGEVSGKRHPADFALWKFAPPGVKRQQEWDSPWGRGFPGWHIECSAMSVKYLGTTFDIHTGGVDHVKVHHTNEIAQSEAALGVHPWVQVWMHHEFLTFEREKMAKSAGNIVVLDDLVARGISPLGYRYFFLQAHYRQRQSCQDEALAAAERGYRRLVNQARETRQAEGTADPDRTGPWMARFRAVLEDDLNAPRALALAWEVTRDQSLGPAERRALLGEFDRVLGLDLATAEPAEAPAESDPRIDELVGRREDARRRRDWAEADRIRAALGAEGVVIEDRPQGPRWRRT